MVHARSLIQRVAADGRAPSIGGPITARGWSAIATTIRTVPIYEFECGSCGARFERLVKAGTSAAQCPECGEEGAERCYSEFGVSRQLTPAQRRRMEDKRGTDRGGARARWQQRLDRARKPRGG
jgi:putative FmdB family regulatory protein